MEGDRTIVAGNANCLHDSFRDVDPVGHVVLHGPVRRTETVIFEQVGLVANLEQVENNPRSLDGSSAERTHDRLRHVDGIGDVVGALVDAPGHVRATRKVTGQVVVLVPDNDVSRLWIRRDRVGRREIGLDDGCSWGPEGVVFGVCANPDLRRLPSKIGVVGECGVREFIARVSASPVGPTVLLEREGDEGTRERLRVRGRRGREGDIDRGRPHEVKGSGYREDSEEPYRITHVERVAGVKEVRVELCKAQLQDSEL